MIRLSLDFGRFRIRNGCEIDVRKIQNRYQIEFETGVKSISKLASNRVGNGSQIELETDIRLDPGRPTLLEFTIFAATAAVVGASRKKLPSRPKPPSNGSPHGGGGGHKNCFLTFVGTMRGLTTPK